MNKKGQSFQEVLITYGWMVMVSLAVIGALAWYGVSSFDKHIPTICTTTGLVHCTDYKIAEDGVQFRLRNNLGQPITGMIVNVEGRGNYNDINETFNFTSLDTETNTQPLMIPIENKGTFTGKITIRYTGREKSIEHKIEGKIAGTPEKPIAEETAPTEVEPTEIPECPDKGPCIAPA